MSTVTQKRTVIGIDLDGMYQVVLYNDEYNTCDHVVETLMRVFGHSFEMAKKLMWEAHNRGKTIAQVEGKGEAMGHLRMLIQAGLMATVSKI